MPVIPSSLAPYLGDSYVASLAKPGERTRRVKEYSSKVPSVQYLRYSYEVFKETFGEHLHRFFKEEIVPHIEVETKEKYADVYYGEYESSLYYRYALPESEDE